MKRLLLAAVVAALACGARAEKVDLRLIGTQGDYRFMTVPATHAHNKDYLTNVTYGMCLVQNHCFLFIWEQGTNAAKRVPMTDKQLKSLLVSYTLNRYTGLNRLLWNCTYFPDTPKEQCL